MWCYRRNGEGIAVGKRIAVGEGIAVREGMRPKAGKQKRRRGVTTGGKDESNDTEYGYDKSNSGENTITHPLVLLHGNDFWNPDPCVYVYEQASKLG